MKPSDWARLWRTLAVLASLGLGVLVWQVATQGLPASVAAPPLASFRALVAMIQDGSLQSALASSLTLFFSGLVLAFATAVPLGLLLARSDWARLAFGDWILLLYAMPTVALIPFILSLFGIGFSAKLLVVVLFAFFPSSTTRRKVLAPSMASCSRWRDPSAAASARCGWTCCCPAPCPS